MLLKFDPIRRVVESSNSETKRIFYAQGAVYKRVIPSKEIDAKARDSFWAREEEEEKRRQAEDARRKAAERQRRDAELKQREVGVSFMRLLCRLYRIDRLNDKYQLN